MKIRQGLFGAVWQQRPGQVCPKQEPSVQVQLLLNWKLLQAWEAAGQLVQLQGKG